MRRIMRRNGIHRRWQVISTGKWLLDGSIWSRRIAKSADLLPAIRHFHQLTSLNLIIIWHINSNNRQSIIRRRRLANPIVFTRARCDHSIGSDDCNFIRTRDGQFYTTTRSLLFNACAIEHAQHLLQTLVLGFRQNEIHNESENGKNAGKGKKGEVG